MKRAISIIGGLLLGSGALFAQVHGPGASVLSSGRGSAGGGARSMATGPASSVLSTGPRGWQTGPCMTPQCVNPAFTPTVNFQTGTVHFGQQFNTGHGGNGGHRHHGGNNNGGGGGGYVYTYPYPVYEVGPEQVEDQQADQQPEPPAPTVFERRSEVRLAPNPTPVGNDDRYGERYLEQRERESYESPNTSGGHHVMSPVSEEQIPVLIVYKDGHEQEIHNYAIVGDTIYDIGTSIAHKIKLADVDLKQTIQKNEQRGVDFTVPASRKPAA